MWRASGPSRGMAATSCAPPGRGQGGSDVEGTIEGLAGAGGARVALRRRIQQKGERERGRGRKQIKKKRRRREGGGGDCTHFVRHLGYLVYGTPHQV